MMLKTSYFFTKLGDKMSHELSLLPSFPERQENNAAADAAVVDVAAVDVASDSSNADAAVVVDAAAIAVVAEESIELGVHNFPYFLTLLLSYVSFLYPKLPHPRNREFYQIFKSCETRKLYFYRPLFFSFEKNFFSNLGIFRESFLPLIGNKDEKHLRHYLLLGLQKHYPSLYQSVSNRRNKIQQEYLHNTLMLVFKSITLSTDFGQLDAVRDGKLGDYKNIVQVVTNFLECIFRNADFKFDPYKVNQDLRREVDAKVVETRALITEISYLRDMIKKKNVELVELLNKLKEIQSRKDEKKQLVRRYKLLMEKFQADPEKRYLIELENLQKEMDEISDHIPICKITCEPLHEIVKEGGHIVATPCGHVFSLSSLEGWRSTCRDRFEPLRCPQCRCNFEMDQVRNIYL